MDYIKFNGDYCFIKDQIKALDGIIKQSEINGKAIVSELYKLLKNWSNRQKQMMAEFKAENGVFETVAMTDDREYKQFLYYVSLLKWNSELCEGKYRQLAIFLWQTADKHPQDAKEKKLYSFVPNMVEILTSVDACVWMLVEVTKRGDFVYDFVKWLLNHDFDNDQIAVRIQQLRLENMPMARMLHSSDSEDVKKLLDLFNS